MADDARMIELLAELSEAKTDSKRVEIAERIIELDGRWDPTNLDHFELISTARQIVVEMIAKAKNHRQSKEH
jgi:hypothetical protein